jgi:hypothetical protein
MSLHRSRLSRLEASARRRTDPQPQVVLVHVEDGVCTGEFAGEPFTVPEAGVRAYLREPPFPADPGKPEPESSPSGRRKGGAALRRKARRQRYGGAHVKQQVESWPVEERPRDPRRGRGTGEKAQLAEAVPSVKA